MKRVALAIGLLALPTSGHAQRLETTLQMQSQCKRFAAIEVGGGGRFAMPQDSNSQSCWGAFAAIQELGRIVDEEGRPLLRFCVRPTSTRIQFIKIFLRYAEQHLEQSDLDFAYVVQRALAEAFPCGSNQGAGDSG